MQPPLNSLLESLDKKVSQNRQKESEQPVKVSQNSSLQVEETRPHISMSQGIVKKVYETQADNYYHMVLDDSDSKEFKLIKKDLYLESIESNRRSSNSAVVPTTSTTALQRSSTPSDEAIEKENNELVNLLSLSPSGNAANSQDESGSLTQKQLVEIIMKKISAVQRLQEEQRANLAKM